MLHTASSSSSLPSLSIPLVRLCLGSSPAGILRTLTNAKNDIVVILILLCSALLCSVQLILILLVIIIIIIRFVCLSCAIICRQLPVATWANLPLSPPFSLSLSHLTPSECATVCVFVCASVLEIFIAPLVLYPFSSCSWRAAPSSGPQLEQKQFANAFSMRFLEMIIKYHKSGLKSQRTRFYSLWSVKAL